MFTDLLLARGTAQYFALESLLKLQQPRPAPPKRARKDSLLRRGLTLLRRRQSRLPALQGCG